MSAADHRCESSSHSLRITRFDRISSFLMALIMVIGCVVMMLFLAWVFANEDVEVALKPERISFSQSGLVAATNDSEFEVPSSTEVVQLTEPSPRFALRSISHVAQQAANASDGLTVGPKDQGGTTNIPGEEDDDAIPRYDRWELRFQASGRVAYARQLDYFQIEIGVIGGQVQGVDLVNHFAANPKSRRVSGEEEQRLYFTWKRPTPLMQYDRQLIREAGVPLQERHILKFIPQDLENQLASAELEHAKDNGCESVTKIVKTVFKSKASGDGFTFEVIEQRYRE